MSLKTSRGTGRVQSTARGGGVSGRWGEQIGRCGDDVRAGTRHSHLQAPPSVCVALSFICRITVKSRAEGQGEVAPSPGHTSGTHTHRPAGQMEEAGRANDVLPALTSAEQLPCHMEQNVEPQFETIQKLLIIPRVSYSFSL